MRAERAGRLPSVGSGFDLLGKAGRGQLPESGLPVELRDGDDAEVLPELGEGAEDGGLGDLFAQLGGKIIGGHRDALGQHVVGREGQRGDLGGPAGGWGLLPCFVAAKSEDVGEGQGETMKSGVSVPVPVGEPRRLSGMAPPSAIRRARRLRGSSVSARVGAVLAAPRMASTNDGAGMGSCGARGT